MPTEETPPVQQPDLELEIAHLLLIDIVGYSKLLADEQVESVQKLGRIGRSTECFRNAEATGKLQRVPTGACMPKTQETSDIVRRRATLARAIV